MAHLLLAALLAAELPVQVPKALVFPNYDNVLLGKNQALEGGAYVARAGDASANFYNPAGLVQSEKTSLNASSTGWVWTKITSKELDTSVTYQLPFLAVLGNDSRWNAEYQIQLREYGAARAKGCEMREIRYEQVVRAFGAFGERVTRD